MKNKLYHRTIKTHLTNRGKVEAIVGNLHSAIGICGTTDGVVVKGELISVDHNNVLIKCEERWYTCLVNEKTLTPIILEVKRTIYLPDAKTTFVLCDDDNVYAYSKNKPGELLSDSAYLNIPKLGKSSILRMKRNFETAKEFFDV